MKKIQKVIKFSLSLLVCSFVSLSSLPSHARETQKFLWEHEPVLTTPPVDMKETDKFYSSARMYCSRHYTVDSWDRLEEWLKFYEPLTASSGERHILKCFNGLAGILDASYKSSLENKDRSNSEEKKIKEWLTKYPNSFYANMVQARLLILKALWARGGDYAHKVKVEDWKKYEALAMETNTILDKYAEEGKNNPLWYYLKMNVSLKDPNLGPRAFFEYALASLDKYPASTEMYDFIVYYIDSPKWYGKPNFETVEDLGQYALKKYPGDKGKIIYAKLYEALADVNFGVITPANNTCVSCNTDFKKLTPPLMNKKINNEGIDTLLKTYPSIVNDAKFFKLACERRDKAQLKKLYPRVKEMPKIEHIGVEYFQSLDWTSCTERAKEIK